MINDTDRQELINYRLEQATETIELARFLIESGKLVVAVNRIYYGMYYAIAALAIQNQFETSKHGQLIGWFNKNFIASGQISTDYGKILRNAYQNRTKGDYDAFVNFENEEVSKMHNEMVQFINMVKEILAPNNQ